MSANNSLTDNIPANDLNRASQYALRVALQTMKERCISLQQRLTVVEEENLALRSRYGIDNQLDNINFMHTVGITEMERLKNEVAELSMQKIQLTEHIAMISTENRQLWSRLSQLAKDNKEQKKAIVNDSGTSQNLIRSKTFTQHSPNPNIRPKHIPVSADKTSEELSLEEVSLKVLNNFTDSKSEIDKSCDEIIFNDGNSLGFGYLNDDASDGDVGIDARKCIYGIHEIKKELLKQQSDLKVAISTLKERRVLQECEECKRRRKPETADKNLETDEILLENFRTMLSPNSSTDPPPPYRSRMEDSADSKFIDILQQKRIADQLDKMCPLCGKTYSSSISFDDFEKHVEHHFIDEVDVDPSIERNFEVISHTVGDF